MILQQLSTYNMANDRGGLQPTPKDQTRDALGRHKDKVETLIEQMERTLATILTSTSALQRRIKNLERDWTEFKAQYLEVHARAEDALDDDQDAEDVRPKELTSEQKVQQYTTKWKGVHHRIDKALEEIEASLEGDPIDSLEVLNVKEYRLMQIKESLKESASLVNSIINEDPEQTNTLLEAEDAKALQAVSKISACKERLPRL